MCMSEWVQECSYLDMYTFLCKSIAPFCMYAWWCDTDSSIDHKTKVAFMKKFASCNYHNGYTLVYNEIKPWFLLKLSLFGTQNICDFVRTTSSFYTYDDTVNQMKWIRQRIFMFLLLLTYFKIRRKNLEMYLYLVSCQYYYLEIPLFLLCRKIYLV